MLCKPRWLLHLVLCMSALALALPVLVVLASWLQWDPQALALMQEMARTVLPDYVGTTAVLCALVSLGVMSMGTVSAALITLVEFPLRRHLEWALLLPMALPAYVVAYAYTDVLQFSGPLQIWLREQFALDGRVLPEIRNVWGAAAVFTVTLYPYVYLLVRTALTERASHLMEAARLLGASLPRRVVRVALPLARPAIAAGVALALMETLADFGVCSYFGIQTFTAGVFKAWLAMDNRVAATQLATLLLVTVLLVLWLEQRAQARLRFASLRGERHSQESRPPPLHGATAWLACLLCAMPVLLGFVLPVLFLLRSLWQVDELLLPWARFAQWAATSLGLGLVTAVLACVLALVLAAQARLLPHLWSRLLVRVVGLGYAIPGAVVVVGLLLPLGWLQANLEVSGFTRLFTTTVLGLIWAYLVRFVAVALQSVQSGYTRVPVHLDDSARMLGVSGGSLFARVHLPLLRRPMLAASLLVMVDVMKELPATLVLRPFNTDTLAVMAYQLARDERLGEAALPSLALVAVGLLPVWLLSRTLRQR